MKNILSTIIVFGVIFLLIIIGAYVFDKFNGFGLIGKVDSSINNGIQKLIGDNNSDLQDNSTDNISTEDIQEQITLDNNTNNTDNASKDMNNKLDTLDNTSYNVSADNISVINDENTQDNISNDNISVQE